MKRGKKEPGAALTRREILRRMRPYLSSQKGTTVLLVITAVLNVPLSLLSPQFYRLLVDEVMGAGNAPMFLVVAGGSLLVYALQLTLDGLNLYGSNRLLNRFAFSLQRDVFEKVLRLPLPEYGRHSEGDMKMRLTDDVGCLGNFVKDQAADAAAALLMAVGCIVLTLSASVKMTLICLCLVPLVYVINGLIGRGTARVNEEIRAVNEKYYTFEHDSLQYWREVKAGNAQREFTERFRAYRRVLAKLGMRSIRYWFYSEVFADFKANYLTKAVVYLVGAVFVIRSELTVGQLLLFGEYFGQLFTSLDALNGKRVALRVNQPYYRRIFETLAWTTGEDTPPQKPETGAAAVPTGGVTAERLTFAYEGGRPVLDRAGLRIEPGEYVALIGPSGCGKTTLIKQFLGLCRPQEGRVLYDCADGVAREPEEMEEEVLYGAVGAVMQDSRLFHLSIRDNLLIAKEGAGDEELIAACRQAGLGEFIASLPDGLDTLVGERGVRLSGGQRQRLTIARVLLRRPRIVLFDEATSAVDRLSEDQINRSVEELGEETTVIVVSHKPSAVLRAEKTYVLCEGRVEDSGKHEELLERNDFYRALAAEA